VFGVVILFSIGSVWMMQLKRRTAVPELAERASRRLAFHPSALATTTIAGVARMPFLAFSAHCVLLFDWMLARHLLPAKLS